MARTVSTRALTAVAVVLTSLWMLVAPASANQTYREGCQTYGYGVYSYATCAVVVGEYYRGGLYARVQPYLVPNNSWVYRSLVVYYGLPASYSIVWRASGKCWKTAANPCNLPTFIDCGMPLYTVIGSIWRLGETRVASARIYLWPN
jgi:hypothetical protein